MIRVFDIIIAATALVVGFPIIVLITLLVYVDMGSPVFRQQRLGINKNPFTLYKFRTMAINTPSLATHQVDPSAISAFGHILRRTKLDELPQLWNVLLGDMSLVGPRPCLPDQQELITERDSSGIFTVRPGITGLAQIKGIDMSTPKLLANTEREMLNKLNLRTYFFYLARTIAGKGMGDRIRRDEP